MSAGFDNPLTVWVDGIGVMAPGLLDWDTASPILRGDAPFVPQATVLPAPALLPPAERRRASRVVKLALGLGLQAAAHAQQDVATLAMERVAMPQ